ncbi:MAG TPA: peptidoglycan recognition family protein [Conexibacter sp.]|nr:peptidoglycan recognition family protein [Conexibacter sp.]
MRAAICILAGAVAAACGACGGSAGVATSSTTAQVAPATASTPTVPPPATAAPRIVPPRPAIEQWRIPLTPQRRAETVAYAERHYGLRRARIARPRVIVEHLTVNDSAAATYAVFAPDVPDGELNELPGLCSQFVIDRDGTIFQLTPVRFMCRHTVGLNWTAIGIEHVGYAEQEVLDDPAQMRASLRLTRWLRCRLKIPVRDVIGHAESLASPYHHERVAGLRSQTHADWQPWAMRRYRAMLRRDGC